MFIFISYPGGGGRPLCYFPTSLLSCFAPRESALCACGRGVAQYIPGAFADI